MTSGPSRTQAETRLIATVRATGAYQGAHRAPFSPRGLCRNQGRLGPSPRREEMFGNTPISAEESHEMFRLCCGSVRLRAILSPQRRKSRVRFASSPSKGGPQIFLDQKLLRRRFSGGSSSRRTKSGTSNSISDRNEALPKNSTGEIRADLRKLRQRTQTEGTGALASPAIKEALKQIQTRLDELRPAHEEYVALAEFAEKFHGFIHEPGRTAATVPKTVKPSTAKTAKAPPKTAAKTSSPSDGRSGHGETLQRIREIVESHPEGISVGDIIQEGQLSTSYTYDVVKRLVERGEFHKANRRIYPQSGFKRTRSRPTVTLNENANA